MEKLTEAQIRERALNKIYAKSFFAVNKLKEILLEVEGVIPSKIGNDILRRNYEAQNNEVLVLDYIMNKLKSK
tara:strand:+ start:176 stop:394 length:219 start_codon:yes stop_codon:yes gene_type:complete